MKKEREGRSEIRREYDFRGGTRGRYAARFRSGTNLVLLDEDVARVFKSSRAVNTALRRLVKTPKKARRPKA